MKNKILSFVVLSFVVLLVGQVNGLYIEESQTISLGHFMRIKNISMTPENIGPGESGIISFNIKNNGNWVAEDLRIKLILPPEFKFYNDVDTVKISKLNSLETREVGFRIIALPSASEGVYNANLTIDYTSYFAANFGNVGNEYQDNFVLGMIIKSNPNIFVEVDDSKIYKENKIGDISFKFVNHEIADVKFLTVELEESEDYEIISKPKEYIGDLDSDDYESVDFRLKVKKSKGEISFPLKIDYKDFMNKDYSDKIIATMTIRSAKELGLEKSNTTIYLIVVAVLGVVGWFVYKKYKNYKRKNKLKKDGIL